MNLLPFGEKVCTWDCLYCQCGWTDRAVDQAHVDPATFPSVALLSETFEREFAALAKAGKAPESLTLSGNGEPTLHPEFEKAVDALIRSRDLHLPKAKTSILSNGERIGEASVRRALDRLDQRCMKLDPGGEKVDRPLTPYSEEAYVANLRHLKPVTIQSFFLGGEDATPWIAHLKAIQPLEVHLYSLDRVPPAKGLKPEGKEVLDSVAERVRAAGFPARVFA